MSRVSETVKTSAFTVPVVELEHVKGAKKALKKAREELSAK